MREPGPESERHLHHRFEGEPDEDLIEALEPDQLEEAMRAPLPRRRLGRWGEVGLWGLRIFVLVVTGLVAYVFVLSLAHGA